MIVRPRRYKRESRDPRRHESHIAGYGHGCQTSGFSHTCIDGIDFSEHVKFARDFCKDFCEDFQYFLKIRKDFSKI